MPPLNTIEKTAIALAIGQSAFASPLQAMTYSVSTLGELQRAIADANAVASLDIINLTTDITNITTSFDSSINAVPIITSSITINGNGHIVSRASNAMDAFRFFEVSGGILTLNNTTLSGGVSYDIGGAIAADTGSTVVLNNSTVSGNSAVYGGGVYAVSSSAIALNNSTVSGNSAVYGGGVYAVSSSTITLSNSTVSGNSAVYGGGVYAVSSSAIALNNSTVSGNSAVYGGGVYTNSSEVTLSNSTVSGNLASYSGGGIYSDSSTVTLNNSIIADSLTGNDCDRIDSTIIANSRNLIEDGSCNTAALTGDPKLGPLGNNGGKTKTHMPLAGSPVINSGDDSICAGPPINNLDQRGEPRPVGGGCDIGSVEYKDESSFLVIPLPNGGAAVINL